MAAGCRTLLWAARWLLVTAACAEQTFTALLSGAQQWPSAVPSSAFGVATVVMDGVAGRLTVSMELHGLLNETAAQICIGLPFEAAPAPAALALPLGSFARTVLPLTPALQAAISTGRAYINLCTLSHATGVCVCVYVCVCVCVYVCVYVGVCVGVCVWCVCV